jgi:LacI family transcriptional regulator
LGDHDAQSPFLQDFLAGITLATGSEGWTLTVATATSEANMAEVLQRLVQERKADGFILPRTTVDDPRVTLLRALNMPMVLFGRTGFGRPDPGPDLSWYDVSGEHAMQDAVLRLADLGHSRIAYVGGDLRYNYSGLRRQGYRDGLAHVGLKHDPEIELANAHSPGDGTRATRHLLSLNAPPTAIVFATDAAAMGAYRAAQDTGLRIGQHLSIIGYDGIPTGEYADPGLTTFSVDSQTAGERLATLLIRQIRGDNPTDLQELARATLVVRGSDGAPALQSADLAKFIQK